MNDKLKLELTLCSIYPYKLQIECDNTIWTLDGLSRPYKTNDKCFLSIGCRYDQKGFPLTHRSFVVGQHEFKPILHSLDNLTKSISPLHKVTYADLLWWDVIGTDSDCFDKKEFFEKCESGLINLLPIIVLNKLLEWHFNVFDLPKSMYLQKSETI